MHWSLVLILSSFICIIELDFLQKFQTNSSTNTRCCGFQISLMLKEIENNLYNTAHYNNTFCWLFWKFVIQLLCSLREILLLEKYYLYVNIICKEKWLISGGHNLPSRKAISDRHKRKGLRKIKNKILFYIEFFLMWPGHQYSLASSRRGVCGSLMSANASYNI